MSNIGKLIINLPTNSLHFTTATENRFCIYGKLGFIQMPLISNISLLYYKNAHKLAIKTNIMHSKIWGLVRKLIQQIYYGITQGYTKRLELVGLGLKCAKRKNNLRFKIGLSHPVQYAIHKDVQILCKTTTQIQIKSILSPLAHLVAYQIYALKIPDVYKNKGIHLVGKLLRKKPGKKKK
jgi:large subunit ribosomal protein L6